MALDHRAKGNGLMAEAEQLLNAPVGACCGSRSRIKVEEACEMYVKAANSFKMAKEWQLAGNAFAEAASLEMGNQRKIESGMHYVEAAKCYKKVNPADCERCLQKATELYVDVGRPRVAAKHHLTMAELFEEQGELKKAVDQYQQAADLFAGEESGASTTKCLLGVANHGAMLGNYERSQEIFEQLGESALSSNLLKYTATDHFVRAGLCRLAAKPMDTEGFLAKLGEWQEISPAFADSRECSWLAKLAETVREQDLDAFNECIRNYESVTRLSDWHQEIMRRVRKHLSPDLR